MDKKGCPKGLMVGSLIAVGLAAIGWLSGDVWLASTQWMLIAVILGIYGLWFKLEK
ncbi:hypothetical protein ISS86_02015 [Candidatus Microgenomates bacterium]|nr:hypothetical protein [Candidatus Microgenomates bacterium]